LPTAFSIPLWIAFALLAPSAVHAAPTMRAPTLKSALPAPAYDVALADLNADGKLDAVLNVNTPAGGATALLGRGDGTFDPAIRFPGPVVTLVAVGEVTGDGTLDVVGSQEAADGSGSVTIFRGSGGGALVADQTIAVDAHPLGIATVDRDGDGRSDIAVADSAGIELIPALGGDTFGAPILLASGTPLTAAFLAVGDWNADGHPDLIESDEPGGRLFVWLGQAGGAFTGPTVVSPGFPLDAMASGDFDGDSKPDLIVSSNGGPAPFHFFRGNGDGTFTVGAGFGMEFTSWGVQAADLDGDGVLDVVGVTKDHDMVNLYHGHGDGTFTQTASYNAGSWAVRLAVGDLDGDGRPDVVAPLQVEGDLSTLLSAPTPGKVGADYAVAQLLPSSIALGDLDGDGVLDAVVGNQTSKSVTVAFGAGGGAWRSPVNLALPTAPTGVAIGDVTGDAIPDIVVASSTLSYLPGTGVGTFGAQVVIPGSSTGTLPQLADLDGDGNLDLVVATSTGSAVYRGLGSGTFASPVPYPAGGAPGGLLLADVDGDGKRDLVTLIAGSVGIRLGGAAATFGPESDLAVPGIVARSVALGDVTGDGLADLVASGGGSFAVLAGLGGGAFGAPGFVTPPDGAGRIALADFDLDGKLDVVSTTNGGTRDALLLSTGGGSFAPAQLLGTGAGAGGALAVGDLDNNGAPDVALACQAGALPGRIATFMNRSGSPVAVGPVPHPGGGGHAIFDLAVRPNPAAADAVVEFTLARAGSARAEVFDLRGRLVWASDLGTLAAGPHRVRIGAVATARAGVYWVRISQGQQGAQTRVVHL